MARIVEPPQPKRVKCNECRATIEYLPEEVQTTSGYSMGESSRTTYVKCPRERCPGRGVISSW